MEAVAAAAWHSGLRNGCKSRSYIAMLRSIPAAAAVLPRSRAWQFSPYIGGSSR